jgi:protein-S-isoprenylcysteine O-methyltransferase Ste14
VLVIAFAWLAAPTLHSLAIGAPVSLVGLWLRGWAAGHLAKNQQLAAGGPYAYVRNPLYAGTLLVAAGLVIATRRVELAVLFGAVFLLVYLPVIQNEEQHLRKIFPNYAAYAERVPALIPYKAPLRAPGWFRWELYMRNQEYQALLGYLAGMLYLIWKAI